MSSSSVVRRQAFGTVLLLSLSLHSPAVAQQRTPVVQQRPRVAQPPSPVGLRAYLTYNTTTPAASQTFEAVVEKTSLTGFGGGVEVIRLWKGLFVRVEGSSTSNTGSRVIVQAKKAESLGIPLTVKMRPIEIAAGWRFRDRLRTRVVPYLGAGIVWLRYQETSDFADTGEDVDETFNGYGIFGGVDVSIWSWLMAGVEAEYRTIPDAIGEAGASKAFGETDLGGSVLRVLIGIRR